MSRPPGVTVGGQAVIEGVMMRAPDAWAVAVRRPDGSIEAKRDALPALTSRSRLARTPFVRGIMVLAESLTLGFKALSWSAEKAADEEEKVRRGEVVLTMVVAVVFALGLFVFVPVLGAGFLKQFVNDSNIAFVIIDGLIRIGLIVGYIWLIGRSDDIQRVFQYHGAEHKTIHAYENGDPLDIEAIQRYSPRHPRCGTSFIIIVAMVAFFVFLLLAPLEFVWQVVARLALIPVIAGMSYEVLKAAAGRRWFAWASRPGIWIQSITTNEPDDHQVEVAVASLLAALDGEAVAEIHSRGAVAAGALAAEYEEDGGDDG
ncbi:MAG: DUF1385 domain-containing protein [Acidimicrobiia bacterium]|nr:MAG: DUF1385 domain-containing protein [Acidimicrobiia bacterium]